MATTVASRFVQSGASRCGLRRPDAEQSRNPLQHHRPAGRRQDGYYRRARDTNRRSMPHRREMNAICSFCRHYGNACSGYPMAEELNNRLPSDKHPKGTPCIRENGIIDSRAPFATASDPKPSTAKNHLEMFFDVPEAKAMCSVLDELGATVEVAGTVPELHCRLLGHGDKLGRRRGAA